MQAYSTGLAGDTRAILSPKSEFFRYFSTPTPAPPSPNGAPPPAAPTAAAPTPEGSATAAGAEAPAAK